MQSRDVHLAITWQAICGRSLSALVNKFRDFGIYFSISLAALAIDMACFVMLNHITPLRAGAAAAIGWIVGLGTHYFLAQNLLYKGMKDRNSLLAQIKSFLSYAAPSIAGLGLTVGIVEIGVALGVSAILAKATAATMSFVLAYLVRNMIFNRPASGLPA